MIVFLELPPISKSDVCQTVVKSPKTDKTPDPEPLNPKLLNPEP